jgi:sec-independent protein translocase protein TatC
MSSENSEEQSGLTLVDHLSELRHRIVVSLYFIIGGMILCYNFTGEIFDIIRKPIAPYLPMGGLVFTGPADKFLAHIKIAAFAGLFISCPFWINQIWKFIGPALYQREKRYTLGFLFSGTFLFTTGVLFAYYLVLPAAFHFLMGYQGDIDKPMITIDQYLSFFLMTALMFGLSFELPLIMTLLGMLGLVSSQFFRNSRRYAVVVMAVISAVITPPDLLSMVMMLVPMCMLYEVGVWTVWVAERKRIREELKQTQ